MPFGSCLIIRLIIQTIRLTLLESTRSTLSTSLRIRRLGFESLAARTKPQVNRLGLLVGHTPGIGCARPLRGLRPRKVDALCATVLDASVFPRSKRPPTEEAP